MAYNKFQPIAIACLILLPVFDQSIVLIKRVARVIPYRLFSGNSDLVICCLASSLVNFFYDSVVSIML